MTSTQVANGVRSPRPSSAEIEGAGRRLAVATAAGAVSGLLVGGIGGRLAMMLLARLSPEAIGIRSDDDFLIGQLTLSGTLNLLLVGTVLGVLGGGVYIAVRSLMIGPRWFQVLSISLGPAVVVGAMLVNPTGVDFTLLRPAWLAIALFIAVPGLYAVLLTILCERWLRPDGTFLRARRWVALAPLILWLPLAPVPLLLAISWFVIRLARGGSATRALVEHPLIPLLARSALVVIFVVSLTGLFSDINALT